MVLTGDFANTKPVNPPMKIPMASATLEAKAIGRKRAITAKTIVATTSLTLLFIIFDPKKRKLIKLKNKY
jgi:hypothetical protein